MHNDAYRGPDVQDRSPESLRDSGKPAGRHVTSRRQFPQRNWRSGTRKVVEEVTGNLDGFDSSALSSPGAPTMPQCETLHPRL